MAFLILIFKGHFLLRILSALWNPSLSLVYQDEFPKLYPELCLFRFPPSTHCQQNLLHVVHPDSWQVCHVEKGVNGLQLIHLSHITLLPGFTDCRQGRVDRLGRMLHTCNPSIWEGEVGFGVPGHPWLHKELESGLGCGRPCLK